MRFSHAILIVFAMALVANCGPSTQIAAAQAQTDYHALGLPPADRPWSSTDYQAAYAALRGLPASQLPRSASQPRILERLTDPAVFSACVDTSAPLTQRFSECDPLFNAAGGTLRLYVTAQQGDLAFSDDTMAIMGFMLQGGVTMATMVDELIPTLNPADPSYSVRMQGLDQMRAGSGQMLQGSVVSLTQDRRVYSDAAATRFAAILAETFPVLSKDLPPSTRQALQGGLAHIARTDPNAQVRDALARYINAPT